MLCIYCQLYILTKRIIMMRIICHILKEIKERRKRAMETDFLTSDLQVYDLKLRKWTIHPTKPPKKKKELYSKIYADPTFLKNCISPRKSSSNPKNNACEISPYLIIICKIYLFSLFHLSFVLLYIAADMCVLILSCPQNKWEKSPLTFLQLPMPSKYPRLISY